MTSGSGSSGNTSLPWERLSIPQTLLRPPRRPSGKPPDHNGTPPYSSWLPPLKKPQLPFSPSPLLLSLQQLERIHRLAQLLLQGGEAGRRRAAGNHEHLDLAELLVVPLLDHPQQERLGLAVVRLVHRHFHV